MKNLPLREPAPGPAREGRARTRARRESQDPREKGEGEVEGRAGLFLKRGWGWRQGEVEENRPRRVKRRARRVKNRPAREGRMNIPSPRTREED